MALDCVIVVAIVVVEEDRSCIVSVTSNPQHISRPSRVSRSVLQPDVETSCGTKTQPWILEAPAGQRINISLLDFTPNTAAAATNFHSPEVLGSSHANLGGSCNHDEMKRQYGFIVDKVASAANRKNVSMCSRAGSSRVTNAYLSTANSVELVLSSDVDKPASQRLSFLVRIEGWFIF